MKVRLKDPNSFYHCVESGKTLTGKDVQDLPLTERTSAAIRGGALVKVNVLAELEVPTPVDYSTYTVKELKAFCHEKNLVLTGRERKADLIALLS
jgi:hypothetical protein